MRALVWTMAMTAGVLWLGLVGVGCETVDDDAADDDAADDDTGGDDDGGDDDGGDDDAADDDGGDDDGGDDDSSTEPMAPDSQVIVLHHSTGGVIWNGGVADHLAAHNTAEGTTYGIEERSYPNSPYPWANYPYDYWYLWVHGAGDQPFEGQDTLEILTQDYDVIVFKHCYPVSGIGPDTGNPDVASSSKTIENYQLQYDALKPKLLSFPEQRFIVWTGAALVQPSTNPDDAARAEQFFEWVRSEWDEPGDNIYVWDFWTLETEGGLYLLEEHASSPGDSHPNDTFADTTAPFLATRIVDVLEGRGDTGGLTGE